MERTFTILKPDTVAAGKVGAVLAAIEKAGFKIRAMKMLQVKLYDAERERLHSILRDNILTTEVRRNGIGGIDPERFERSIDQVAEDFKFQKRPQASDIFDDQFLPPLNGRLIN